MFYHGQAILFKPGEGKARHRVLITNWDGRKYTGAGILGRRTPVHASGICSGYCGLR
jgi:hypothetical protein